MQVYSWVEWGEVMAPYLSQGYLNVSKCSELDWNSNAHLRLSESKSLAIISPCPHLINIREKKNLINKQVKCERCDIISYTRVITAFLGTLKLFRINIGCRALKHFYAWPNLAKNLHGDGLAICVEHLKILRISSVQRPMRDKYARLCYDSFSS